MNDKYKRIIEMSALPLMLLFLSAVALTFQSCKGKSKNNNLSAATDSLSDDALMDTVQRRTFLYFWEGAEPNSGLAPERYHVDGVYPENDANVVTSGGSGFGIMAILAGIDRGYVTREEGLARMERIVSFLEKADRFHGAYPHWWYGDTGKVKPFGQKDNGGDLVETDFPHPRTIGRTPILCQRKRERESPRPTDRPDLAGCRLELVSARRTKRSLLALESDVWLGNEFPCTRLQRMYDYVYSCRRFSYTRSTCGCLS